MNDLQQLVRHKPPMLTAWAIGLSVVAIWGLVRLYIFTEVPFRLTYVIPLLVCIWTRNKAMLWTMVGIFLSMAAVKYFLILPEYAFVYNVKLQFFISTVMNVSVGALIIHMTIELLDRLEMSYAELAGFNNQVLGQNDQLEQQSEELLVQNEELQLRSREINELNVELSHREDMLQSLLESARVNSPEQKVLEDVCIATVKMFDTAASDVVVYEKRGDLLMIRAHAGLAEDHPSCILHKNTFAELVIRENHTISLRDTALRPDLSILHIPGRETFRAVLGSPMHRGSKAIGAVIVYGRSVQEWTEHHFRMAEWTAAQCGRILETIRMQKDLQRVNEQITGILESITDAFTAWDCNWRYTYINAAAERLLARRRDELLGTDARALFPKDAAEPFLLRFKQAMAGKKPVSFEEYLPPLDKWIDVRAYPSKEGLSVYFRDITEYRRSEEALQQSRDLLQSVIDNTTALVYVMDLQGCFVIANRALGELTGLAPQEIVGRKLHEFLPADIAETLEENDRRIIATGCPFEFEDVWNMDDRRPAFLTTMFPLRDTQGEIWAVGGVSTDITTRKQAEEMLRKNHEGMEKLVKERTAELEMRNKLLVEEITERKKAEEEKKRLENQLVQSQKMEALGTFAGGIAHDMNNLLYPVIVETETLLEEAPMGSSLQESLGVVLNAAIRQRDLVKQILTFSRRSEQKIRPIHLSPLTKETLAFLRSSLPSTIEIRQRIDAPDDMVLGNPTMIQQVIMNVCKNAADAMDSQRGCIEVSLDNACLDSVPGHPEVRPGEYVRLMVRDTGSGIPPDVIERIFDPFFTTKGVGKGSGMGLAIVHGIVKDHGGTVIVESEPGKGTLFIIYLPVAGERRERTAGADGHVPARKKKRILLIDDEEIILSSVGKALKQSGYEVIPEHDCLEALDLFSKDSGAIDLVITDLTMPKMTGIELAERIKDIRTDVPVILSTGYSDVVDDQEALSKGVSALLMKPAGTEELMSAVSRALGR